MYVQICMCVSTYMYACVVCVIQVICCFMFIKIYLFYKCLFVFGGGVPFLSIYSWIFSSVCKSSWSQKIFVFLTLTWGWVFSYNCFHFLIFIFPRAEYIACSCRSRRHFVQRALVYSCHQPACLADARECSRHWLARSGRWSRPAHRGVIRIMQLITMTKQFL